MGRAGIVALVALVAVACVASQPQTYEVSGSIQVADKSFEADMIQMWCEKNRPDLCPPDETFNHISYLERDQVNEVVFEYLIDTKGDDCSDGWGEYYTDIHEGAEVLARDGEGVIIGNGQLGAGTLVLAAATTGLACEFEFTVEVPEADFYTFEVARRGGPVYSKAEMEEEGWEVALQLVRDT